MQIQSIVVFGAMLVCIGGGVAHFCALQKPDTPPKQLFPAANRLPFPLPKILRRDEKTLSQVIARCCEIKAEVVGQDETETGLRAVLNFGHTIGHAIENSFGYGKHLHGEAISIGQVAAAKLSHRILGLPAGEVVRIERLFLQTGLPTRIKLQAPQHEKLFAAMKLDKKVSGGEIKFVLAKKIGRVVWGQRVPGELIHGVLK